MGANGQSLALFRTSGLLLKSQVTVRSADPLEEVSSCGRVSNCVSLTGARVIL